MLGDRGHQRRGGRVGVLSPEQVHGAAGTDHLLEIGGGSTRTGNAAASDRLLKEQRHRLLDRRDRIAGGPVIAVQSAAQKSIPERRRGRMGPQDLLRLGGVVRVGDPHQDVVQRCTGERCRVEVRLQHLGRLRSVEPSRLVACAAGHRPADGSRGERLGPALGVIESAQPSTGSHTSAGDAGREVERVEDVNGPITSRPRPDGQVEILGLSQRHERGTRSAQQRGCEQVQRLARPLRPVDAGRAVERHPHVDTARDSRPPKPPAKVGRLDDSSPPPSTRSGRILLRLRMS